MVTAEHKRNAYGARYIYYHCEKKALGPRCPERSLEEKELDRQIAEFLGSLVVDPRLEAWAMEELANDDTTAKQIEEARLTSLSATIAACEKQLQELTGLRLRSLIEDDEFTRERRRIENERALLAERLAKDSSEEPIELFRELISFSNQAVDWFSEGSLDEKRLLFKTVSSNSTLTGKKLSVEAAKPFVSVQKYGSSLQRRAWSV